MTYDPRLRIRLRDADDSAASVASWLRRRRGRQRAELVGPPAPPTLARVVDAENLLDVYYELKAVAGQAPGPDGVAYADLSRSEVGHLMRQLSRAALAGTYRPGPGRRVSVPKTGGGRRVLTIRDVSFRVLSAALNEAMTPVWESVFAPWSMGFRPGRSVQGLLAALEYVAIHEQRWILAVDDVKGAFDNVRIDDVLADHGPYVRDPALLPLIDVVLRGGDPAKVVGIDQGSAYSPTALNVRLHHAHDQYTERIDEAPPRLRYADNLAYVCRDVSEGNQAMNQSQSLLEKAGFSLKGKDGPPVDLRQDRIQLLGFFLSVQDGKMRYELGEDAWTKLEQNLIRAHEAEDPTDTAYNAVNGWVEAYGPAFESRVEDDVLNHVLETAADYGFRELDDPEMLARRWRSSWSRWQYFRREVHRLIREEQSQDHA